MYLNIKKAQSFSEDILVYIENPKISDIGNGKINLLYIYIN